MICTACKAEFDDNSRFCPRCGAAKPDAFSSEQREPISDREEKWQNMDTEQSAYTYETKQGTFEPNAEKPFFSETPPNNSAYGDRSAGASNSGTPYAPGYRPLRTVPKSSWYTPPKSARENTENRQEQKAGYTRSAYDSSQNAQGYNNNHQAYTDQNGQYTGFPFQTERTFDDKSVRNFLIGFSIVALAVVILVIALVVTWQLGQTP